MKHTVIDIYPLQGISRGAEPIGFGIIAYICGMKKLSEGIHMSKTKERKSLCAAAVCGVFVLALGLCVLFVSESLAQEMFIYPEKGQSNEQMEKDKFECYTWAKNQSGFDPMEVPTATAPPPKKEAQKGGAVRGAAGGALVGAGIGAIAGDAGKGAAIGAIGGGVFGGARRHEQKKQQEHAEQQWAQEQTAQYAQRRNSYNRAHAACLEGRGYTVK
jgi:hypothetical protein